LKVTGFIVLLLVVGLLFLVFARSPVGTDSYWIASVVRDGGLSGLSRPPLFFVLGSLLFKLGLPLLFLMRFVPVVGLMACFFSLVLLARKVLVHYRGEFGGLGQGFWVKLGVPDWFFLGLMCFGFPVFLYRGFWCLRRSCLALLFVC